MQQTVVTQSRIDHSNAKAAIMSSNHESTTAVFNAFIEASKALDELPRVKADLEAAQSLASETENKFAEERRRNEALRANLDALTANLSAKEADLAQATKSNRDLSAVVDLIRGSLPPVPVAPSPATGPSDMPAGTVSAANTEQGQTPAGAARLNPDPQGPSATGESSGGMTNSTTNTDTTTQGSLSSPSNTSTESSSNAPQGQHDAGPTNTSTPTTGGERETDPMNQNPSSATANNNTTQPHPADSPSAGGTTGQQGQGSGDREPSGEAAGSPQGSVSSSPSPHTPSGISAFGPNASPEPRRPHWTKPNEQSWQSWVAQGGEPAPWMR